MNKKGFTLIELLAAITILGILMGIAIPAIMHLITDNRNKIYITDAKKLVALAEYNIRAKSSQLHLPKDESKNVPPKINYLVLYFSYLDNGDFDSTPNGGVYDPNYSFVAIQNVDGKLYYSVMLVEKLKNDIYKGIKLIPYEALVEWENTNKKPDTLNDNRRTNLVEEEKINYWSDAINSLGPKSNRDEHH